MDLICCCKNLWTIYGLETALSQPPFAQIIRSHPLQRRDRTAGWVEAGQSDARFENGNEVKLKLPL
jgi:hypothetical protein